MFFSNFICYVATNGRNKERYSLEKDLLRV